VYLLCTINVVFMLFFGVCFHISGSQGGDWAENFWMGFTFAADMAEDDHGGPFPYWHTWIFRAMNFTFSFGGAFVFGLVINFLSAWIDERVTGLREGKSKVLESGHTLIIGWNDRILSLLIETCEANESEGGLPIAIIADRDKIEMDEFLMDAMGPDERQGSKIVTRKGNPIEPSKLRNVAVRYARSIVVLSEGQDPDEADAQAVRRVLALTAGLESQGVKIRSHIVLEIQDIDNAEVAMLGVTSGVPEDCVVPVISHDIIGKLMIQCAREIGLSKCFANLMTFRGSESYFMAFNSGDGHDQDGAEGKRFEECLYHFADACVIGIRFANPNSPEVLAINPAGSSPFQLNPSGDYVIQRDDKLLVVAEDNDSFSFGPSNKPEETPVPPFSLPPPDPERFLLAGWRRDMDDIVRELDKWAPPGSYLSLFNRFSCEQQLQLFANGGLTLPPSDSNEFDVPDDFVNLTKIELIHGNCCKGSELERLGPAKLPDEPQDRKEGSRHRLEDYDTVLTLSIDAAAAGGMSADSRVMVGMLITRFIQTQRKVDGKTLVAEIRDPRTQELMAFTNCTDSIVGNEIVAMILAQIAEDVDIRFVMEDLFSEEGMEMHVKDIRLFVAPGEYANWWTLVERCHKRGMVPMGWIRRDGSNLNDWDAVFNPEDKDTAFAWTGKDAPHGDMLIVISED